MVTLPSLIIRSGSRVCGIPLTEVRETMRPLPTQSIPDVPPFVVGLARIRGAALPVIDLDVLLGETVPSKDRRFVTVRAGRRTIALVVDEVRGIRDLETNDLTPASDLGKWIDASWLRALSAKDEELLSLLTASRMLTDDVWEAVDRSRGGSNES